MKHSIFAVPALLLATSSAFAGTAGGQFNVSMQVVPSCTVSVNQPPTVQRITVDEQPDFWNLDQMIPIRCTKDPTYTVTTNADADGNIAFAGADGMSMTIWQDLAMTKKFGSKENGQEYVATSNGTNAEYIPTVVQFNYPNGRLPTVGNYSADIVNTVTF